MFNLPYRKFLQPLRFPEKDTYTTFLGGNGGPDLNAGNLSILNQLFERKPAGLRSVLTGRLKLG